MANMKWFEKKWFVNLKITSRLRISFLFISIISAFISIAAICFVAAAKVPNSLIFMIIIGVVAVIEIGLSLLLAYINAFLVADPMIKNTRIIDRYSIGDFNTDDIIRKRDWITAQYQDEIGACSRKIKDVMSYLKNLDVCIRKVADGDLSVDVPVRSDRDEIGNALSKLVINFNELVSSIVEATDQVSSGASLVSNSSQTLSEGASQQASAIEELTASIDEIATQTQQSADNAKRAAELADSTRSTAEQGNSMMKEMLKAMSDIALSSNNINKVIKVIDEIAFQTNILSLNAAVEAARAGEHGKGFAVVAEEVRNLSIRSASAAKETTEMIESSLHNVENGTQIADSTAKALDEIVSQVVQSADFIDSIAKASVEQAESIGQINQGLAQVSSVIQTNAATAQESAATSEELSGQAEELKKHVAAFQLKYD